MDLALALIAGYLIGSIPTANAIAGLFGIDLRSEGSGNPGANNARRLGGPGLSIAILSVEAAKGAAAVVAGVIFGGSPGMAAAGLAAATGNVYNVWYRFQGGKGLGITLGVLLVAWPLALPPVIVTIAALDPHNPVYWPGFDRRPGHAADSGAALVSDGVAQRMGRRRRIAAVVGDRPDGRGRPETHHRRTSAPSSNSRVKVTGPSLTRSTAIFAPKTPLEASRPRLRKPSTICSISGSA